MCIGSYWEFLEISISFWKQSFFPRISPNLVTFFYFTQAFDMTLVILKVYFRATSYRFLQDIANEAMFSKMFPTFRFCLFPTLQQFNCCFSLHFYWNELTCSQPKWSNNRILLSVWPSLIVFSYRKTSKV